MSLSNSSFIEIPLGLQWTEKKFKIGISAIYRDFAVFTDARDPTDFGIVPSLLYRFDNKVVLALNILLAIMNSVDIPYTMISANLFTSIIQTGSHNLPWSID